jgi:hypothetical protein
MQTTQTHAYNLVETHGGKQSGNAKGISGCPGCDSRLGCRLRSMSTCAGAHATRTFASQFQTVLSGAPVHEHESLTEAAELGLISVDPLGCSGAEKGNRTDSHAHQHGLSLTSHKPYVPRRVEAQGHCQISSDIFGPQIHACSIQRQICTQCDSGARAAGTSNAKTRPFSLAHWRAGDGVTRRMKEKGSASDGFAWHLLVGPLTGLHVRNSQLPARGRGEFGYYQLFGARKQ